MKNYLFTPIRSKALNKPPHTNKIFTFIHLLQMLGVKHISCPLPALSSCPCAETRTKMSENNPLHPVLQTFNKIANCIQTHLSFISQPHNQSPATGKPSFVISSSAKVEPSYADSLQHATIISKGKSAPVTKEELGRATWTFLHTLAAQYPENPTRQQKKDVKELMAILSRMYPCKECADHFKEVLRANPVQVGSHAEFSQWMCHVHNVVNRSLGKLVFPCERVDARWGKLECEYHACDLLGTMTKFGED